MKKGIITTTMAAVVAASLSFVYAQTETNQPPMPPGQHWQHRLDRMSEELNLTPEQKTNVAAIFDEFRQKVQEAKTNADTQLQGVLTPEQFQKLQEHWQMHKRGGHGEHHWGEGEEGGTNTDTNATGNANQ